MSNDVAPKQQAGEPIELYRARMKAWENTQNAEALRVEIAEDETDLSKLENQS